MPCSVWIVKLPTVIGYMLYFYWAQEIPKLIDFRALEADCDVRVTPDGKISCIDWTMVLCNQNNDNAGKKWRRFKEQYDEIKHLVVQRRFPGPGQKPTDVIGMGGALRMAMLMTGKGATAYRDKACEILKNYFAGDVSMHAEPDADAASSAAVTEGSRDEVDTVEQNLIKKRRCIEAECAVVGAELVLYEKRAALARAKHATAVTMLSEVIQDARVVGDESRMTLLRENVQNKLYVLFQEISAIAVGVSMDP
jgi:hypothetical protein